MVYYNTTKLLPPFIFSGMKSVSSFTSYKNYLLPETMVPPNKVGITIIYTISY